MGTIAAPPLLKITAWQLAIVGVLACVIAAFDWVAAYSLLAGGLIHVVGSSYFSRQVFRYQGARQMHKTVQAMYRGETGKILLSASLFVMAFLALRPLNHAMLFAGYLVMVPIHLGLVAKMHTVRRH